MTPFRLCVVVVSFVMGYAISVQAQARTDSASDLGPAAATSFAGDTGLWFVSAADVLPAGTISGGLHHATELRDQNSTKVSYSAVTLAHGIGGRTEVFGTWHALSEIAHRDARGDALAGVKFNLFSERREAPLGLAVRGVAKLPVGEDRVSSGEPDLLTEVIASKRLGLAEVTSSTGFMWRGDGHVASSNGLRSGLGLAVLAHPSLRVFSEVHGEVYRDNVNPGRLVSPLDTPTTAGVGLSWQLSRTFTLSSGLNRAFGGRKDARGVGAVVRFGFRPAARRSPAVAATAESPSLTMATAPPPPPSPTARRPSGSSAASEELVIRQFEFDDVFFDFDRYSLRPEALPILDQVVAALGRDAATRLSIEGYTCDIGTLEYNLALSERRANAVREYLVGRGVADSRLATLGYGEERFQGDDFTEGTRARNRRAAMTVRVLR